MTKEFCKIFYHDEIGQVVVMKDNDEDGDPTITFTISVNSELVNNVVSRAVFYDTKERDAAFNCLQKDVVEYRAVHMYELAQVLEKDGEK
jgi:hypothetical protein